MATTLKEFQRSNPGIRVNPESTGKWLVVWCRHASRYESYFAAREAVQGACTVCGDGTNHKIVELAIPAWAPARPTRFREIGY